MDSAVAGAAELRQPIPQTDYQLTSYLLAAAERQMDFR